ncbi:hypothetical protein DM02DRAFT_674158 [Periconia macrospinosa]|uniref:Tat pathway signal sequence n=1 Tax=Periconia macrospinosa TaxID=97972 RepID=A0A2V1DHB0_9PLEO|nr:hypothetical protein DM02DRAFT_674158 [Periconia macrospinosa]
MKEENSSEPLLYDEEDTSYATWKESQMFSSSSRIRKSFVLWVINFFTSLCSAIFLLFLLAFFCPQFLVYCLQNMPGSEAEYAYKHFPLRDDIRWVKLPGDPEYWSNMLYMGEASPESDMAWNELIRRHGFRALDSEAQRLNLTSSLPLEKGGMSASLGVDHNLHCLRHFKQWYFKDYYYANKTEEDLAWIEGHTLHCLETLRKSVMCFPDLNLSPYYMDPGEPHHPTHISTWGVKQCVDYDMLNRGLDGRRYPRSEYPEEVKELLDAANRG